ncbi:hypothetical protein D3C76_1367770 [compost metagenome]
MLQLACAKTGFFLELPVGCRQHVFARLDQALGQRQLVFIGAAAVFLHQHGVLGVEHGHDHHRAVAVTPAHQTLVGTLSAIAEAQLHGFDAEQTAAGDDFAAEDGGFLAHGAAPWRERVTIPWLAD